jgi:hypothetical protein
VRLSIKSHEIRFAIPVTPKKPRTSHIALFIR